MKLKKNDWTKNCIKYLVILNKLDDNQNKEYPHVVDWCNSVQNYTKNFNEKSYITKTVCKPKLGLIHQVQFKKMIQY